MIETFYKTKVPEGQHEQHAYEELLLKADSSRLFTVERHQGWWDDGSKETRRARVVVENGDNPLPEADAWKLYNLQRDKLLLKGFNHVYQQDFMTGGFTYTYVPPPESPGISQGDAS
jgi:hypothetical protein